MNIIFDVHIMNPNLPNELTLEENTVLNEIYDFVEQRVEPLKDEIEKEEREYHTPNKPPAIVIYLKEMAIQPGKYSNQLHNKILDCFSKEDVEYMWLKVRNSLTNLLN